MSSRDYFYAENYYDYAVQLRSLGNYTAVHAAHRHWNSLTRLLLTILLRVGFVLVQLGSVPMNNVNLILLQNAIDFCCVSVAYFLTGFLIAYNDDLTGSNSGGSGSGVGGLIGGGRWIGDPTSDMDEAIAGWQAVQIASAICTAAVVGRMHMAGYLLMGVLLSGLIQPLLIHWAWTADGWMMEAELAGSRVAFRDYAGAAVVHAVGGLSGLIGCVILGRRMLRLRDLDDASITAGSVGTAFGGLLLILVGLQGLCMGAHERGRSHVYGALRDPSHAYVNNLLAASSCCLLVVALHLAFKPREALNHWTVMRCAQATIAGVVAVSAAANDYSPQVAIGLGCLGGVAFYLIARRVFRSALEDYCNVTAAHLGCAILGSVVAPICAMRGDEGVATTLSSLAWQSICLAALLALVGAAMLLIFGALECCGVLRNRSECLNHVRANAAVGRVPPRSFLQRLFFPDGGSLYLQPSTGADRRPGVGSRFWKYRTKIDEFEEGRSTAASNKPDANVKIEDDDDAMTKSRVAPDTRVRKVRQVHTLSGCAPATSTPKDRGGTGESIDDARTETRRDPCHGRGTKYTLDPIEETDEESSRELEAAGNGARLPSSAEDRDATGDRIGPIPTADLSAESEEPNESSYRLRRTVKLTNLHRELIKDDVRVVLGPKRVDSSSSDSCDEDGAFAGMVPPAEDLSESARNVVTGS